jgi:serine/threonine-protein kinase
MNPSSALPSPYPAAGEVVDGKYQIERILGEGGMGMVARAYHRVLHAPVALKFMNPQFMTFPGAVERFINEGKASSLIKSDHIVPVTDAGKLDNGTPFLVMECLEGIDLADLLQRDGTPGLPIQRAVHFVLQVLRGLQAAHAIGIIHRDMKPSNCFVVSKDGEDDFVKILDFGISKVQQPGSASLTQTNSALGTPLYMSPEQARSPRDVDARSDLYSVGVILYELLTGHTPFFSESGEFTEILFKLFTAEPPPVQSTRPDIPDGLAQAVHKALAREVGERFASAIEMAEAIAPFAGERSQHIVQRMRGFKGPSKSTVPPPELLPSSMVAFSQLDKHPGPPTDVMPNRPTTDMMKGPPVTALMENAPGRVPAPARGPMGSAPEHRAQPVDVAARARPEEAAARTQYDSHTSDRPHRMDAPGASTDLGASRDTSQPSTDATPQKRSPLVWVVLGVVVLAIGGGAIAAFKSLPTKSVSTSEPTGSPPPSAAPSVPSAAESTRAAPPPPTPPTESVASSAPSAKPPPKAPPHKPPGTSGGASGSSGALQTQPHLD